MNERSLDRLLNNLVPSGGIGGDRGDNGGRVGRKDEIRVVGIGAGNLSGSDSPGEASGGRSPVSIGD